MSMLQSIPHLGMLSSCRACARRSHRPLRLQLHLHLHLHLCRRPYSSSPPHAERVTVSARSNGSFTIDIFQAAKPASPILIYLPPGPVIPDHEEEEAHVISTLALASNATIARINYRASPLHRYPTPIHDTLLGYDWIKTNLLDDGVRRPVLPRMGVCGELVGASLAVMLGLTECRPGEARIGAASVNNPIVDWVFPDDLPVTPVAELPEPLAPEETAFPAEEDPMSLTPLPNKSEPTTVAKTPKRTAKPPPPTAWQLYGDNAVIPTVTLSGERDVLFLKPEHYFDRFASPIHWFRSPHGTLIYPRDDDSLASEQPDGPMDYETQMNILHYQTLDSTPSPVELPTLSRCRAYARIYPPAGASLSLPTWQVTAGTESPLHDQATELTKMLKRSVARQTLKNRSGRGRYHDATEKESYEAYADTRVELHTVPGIGLWTQQEPTSPWKMNVERMGHWMKENLKSEF
ncbi:alpha/beta-hydrolase [Byssothecium circinans]|uniref:Alpha/beta-hydrolase n=1 Tax=Byssothecium circinans TaxID=147558 RepID=A0A6A5UIF7_9PLEO|nr:alpha/beta-hydrolase [Byssothecium circinans]